MQLPVRSFSQLMQDMSATLQSSLVKLADLSPGSVLRAILEANASVVLWVQFLVTQLLQATRASTSSGADLDTWVEDFGLRRLAASPAVGQVSFSRYVSSSRALVPVGTRVKTSDGTVTFTVVLDERHEQWSSDENAYVLAPGLDVVAVPVAATVSGSAGNVQSGTITLLASSLIGIDEVSNAAPLSGGIEAEADAALRKRFHDYINSRSRATRDAIGFAVASVRQGLSFSVHENVDASGAPALGSFLVTVDDGTGAPPSSLLAVVARAIDQVRPLGSRFSVQPPVVKYADITMHVIPMEGVELGEVRVEIIQAVRRFTNSLPVGAALSVTRVAQAVYQASTKISNVRGILINGASDDLIVNERDVVKSGVTAVI